MFVLSQFGLIVKISGTFRVVGECNPKISSVDFFQLNPLPDNKILDWSKLKQIADGILKCI